MIFFNWFEPTKLNWTWLPGPQLQQAPAVRDAKFRPKRSEQPAKVAALSGRGDKLICDTYSIYTYNIEHDLTD